MSSARTAVAGAAVGAIATVVGAAIGVAGTLYVSSSDRAAAAATELRRQRGEVYLDYVQQTYRYAKEQTAYHYQRGRHCLFEVTEPSGRVTCESYETTARLESARIQWLDARDLVLIYGSRKARAAESDWSDLVSPEVPIYAPTSQTMRGVAANRSKALDRYNAAEEAFKAVMCADLSAAKSC